jgi:hypothetical protein
MNPQSNSVPFVPSRHGFHFINGFENVILPASVFGAALESVLGSFLELTLGGPFGGLGAIVGIITGSTQNITVGGGQCGGMSWLALDYWFAQQPTPTCIGLPGAGTSTVASGFGINDFALPDDVPAAGTPLATAINARFMNSLLTTTMWAQAVNWTIFQSGQSVAQMTAQNEVPSLVSAIDSGNPVVLTLIPPNPNVADAHIVVATGYSVANDGSLHVSIYDVNFPDLDNIVLAQNPDGSWNEFDTSPDAATAATNSNAITQLYGNAPSWNGWFVQDYSPAPPPFVDFQMASAFVASSPAQMGHPFSLTCSFTNGGAYPAHAQAVQLVTMHDANSATILATAALPSPTLDPGQPPIQLSYSVQAVPFAGNTRFFVQYQTLEGWWITMPGGQFAGSITVPIEAGAFLDGISIQSVSTSVNAQGRAFATVTCSTTPLNFGGPVTVDWTVDGNPSGTGLQQTFTIPLGHGTTLDLVHTLSATATATVPFPNKSTATATLTIPRMYGQLEFDQQLSKNSGISQTTSRGYGSIALYSSETAYSAVAVAASIYNAIGAVTYAWTPTPASTSNGGAVAVFNVAPQTSLQGYAGESVTVRLTATDAAGQVSVVHLTVQAVQSTITGSALTQLGLNPSSLIPIPISNPLLQNIGDPFGIDVFTGRAIAPAAVDTESLASRGINVARTVIVQQQRESTFSLQGG